jgi:DNA-binding LacI/PurR family transcriptional regulator
MSRQSRPTIYKVAQAVGVAPSTVSRAFRHPHLVQADTRERIRAAAASLGYQPSAAATALSTGRSGQIGLVIPNIENPFFPALVKEAESLAQARGHSVILGDTSEDPVAEQRTVTLLARHTDGLVLCSPRMPDEELERIASEITLVLVNRRVGRIPAVVLESGNGMHQAISHLAALGHRSIAYALGPTARWSNRERLEAFRSAGAERDIELIELGPFDPLFEAGLQAADEALACGVTAIIAFNDLMALGAVSRLEARGVAVPAEVSVIGFDDIWIAELWSPSLTTIALPTRQAGRTATNLLLDLLAGIEPLRRQLDLQGSLVVRSSTAPPP